MSGPFGKRKPAEPSAADIALRLAARARLSETVTFYDATALNLRLGAEWKRMAMADFAAKAVLRYAALCAKAPPGAPPPILPAPATDAGFLTLHLCDEAAEALLAIADTDGLPPAEAAERLFVNELKRRAGPQS